MAKPRLLVLLIDALIDDDMPLLAAYPHAGRLLQHAAGIRHMRSIYPTFTYPAHVSILSGTYPDRHGVVHNAAMPLLEGVKPDYTMLHAVRPVDDLFLAAKRVGLSTAAVYWPVVGGHPAIDYLIDEIWPGKGETEQEAFLRSGTTRQVLDEIVTPNLSRHSIYGYPALGDFIIGCACDMIARYQPEVMLLHPGNMDWYRHRFGVYGKRTMEGLAEVDGWIGQLTAALAAEGLLEDTNFVLMSDHGQLDAKRELHLNVLLREEGLIEASETGGILSWQAYAMPTGMSAHIYLRDPADSACHDRVHSLLRHWRDAEVYGIDRVFTTQEIREAERLDGPFSFVVESDGFSSFGGETQRPYVRNYDVAQGAPGHGKHGFLPDRGPQPVFYAVGPAFAPDAVLERSPLVNIAPTLARALGADMPDADGAPLEGLLR